MDKTLRPASDRFPPDSGVKRTPEQRPPSLAHTYPEWYGKDVFIGEKYRDQLGDNTVYHDEASNRHAELNRLNNRSPLHNYFYKQEKPHDRPDRPEQSPHGHIQPSVKPSAEDYEYVFPEVNERGHTPTGSHK